MMKYCNLENYSGKPIAGINTNFAGNDNEFTALLMQLINMSTLSNKVAKIKYFNEPSIEQTKPFYFYYNDFIEAKNLYQITPSPENKRNIMKWKCVYKALTLTDIQIIFLNDNDEPVENNVKLLEFITHFFAAIELDEVLPLNSTIGWRSKIGFGKYAKYTFRQILDQNPSYLDWLKDKSDSTSSMVNAAHKFCVEHSEEINNAMNMEEHIKNVWKMYYSK